MNLRREIESLLKPLPKRISIAFALHCAKDVKSKAKAKDKALVDACISLVEEWLELGPSKELELRLRDAANAAYAAYAANAANAAANAAYATYAAANAAYAAYAAAYVAYAAYAADAAADAAKMKEYKEVLIGMIHSMPRVEKLVFNVEEA